MKDKNELYKEWVLDSEKFETEKWQFWSGRLAIASGYVLNSDIYSLSENLKFLGKILDHYNSEIFKKAREKF
jgi:hypothetical protein